MDITIIPMIQRVIQRNAQVKKEQPFAWLKIWSLASKLQARDEFNVPTKTTTLQGVSEGQNKKQVSLTHHHKDLDPQHNQDIFDIESRICVVEG